MKLRRMVSAVPNPHRWAIASMVSDVASRSRRAASTRTALTYCAGLTPVCPVKQRVKCRSLLPAVTPAVRPQVAIAYVDRIDVDGQLREAALQCRRPRPVRGDAASVAQAGGSGEEGTGAHLPRSGQVERLDPVVDDEHHVDLTGA
jgi:hypothetical protein